jgi:histidine ammonia-lyase
VSKRPRVTFGGEGIRVEEVVAVAEGRAFAELSNDAVLAARIARGLVLLEERRRSGEPIYGVTTGFGDSCDNAIDEDHQLALARNLVRFHRCGVGDILGETESRAVMVARLASLARGYSAVRVEVLDALVGLVNSGAVPRIPSLGSVGASGDLTPLAYVAAALLGEGQVLHRGESRAAAELLPALGLVPVALRPKESLALMNGTSLMAGLTALGFHRARRLARFAAQLTALSIEALGGRAEHMDDRIFELKPHPGQRAFARWVREDLGTSPLARPREAKLQDRYSVRCAPQVVGVLLDVLPSCRTMLETELGSVNDNPIVDPESGRILHNGNFYGGHVGHVADTLKTCVASVADLLDRQLALLLSPHTSGGLPRDLVRSSAPGSGAHHGFKAMQITASALTAEALKATMPASAFSRSTENHNQDKVSMGSIGARELLRVVELTEMVAAIHALALTQAIELRGGKRPDGSTGTFVAHVRGRVPALEADRPMDVDIEAVLGDLRSDRLPLGPIDFA